MIGIQGVTKRFGDHLALDRVDLDVPRGQTVALIGPSGSGKSTLLKCVNYQVVPDAGSVSIHGRTIGQARSATAAELRAWRRGIGMVFQNFNLFPHLTALQNCMEGPRHALGLPRAEAQARAEEVLEKVGLADLRHRRPMHLSGGQQQRVAIARALAMQPKVMLFDEPTSALDPELVGEVLRVMQWLAEAGTTMIVVTHEMGFARNLAHRVVFFDHGRILEQGAPAEVFGAPADPRLRNFLSHVGAHRRTA